MNQDKEIWKCLIYQGNDYSDFYEVSNYGNIRNSKTKRLRKLNLFNGYPAFNGSLGSRQCKKCIRVHKAVAETFIPNPNNYPIINHKDGDKTNNHVSNLEWCTQSHNVRHAFDNGLISVENIIESHLSQARPVAKYDADGDMYIYPSTREAARDMCDNPKNIGGISSHIIACCKGERKTAYGLFWKYI